MLSTKTFSVVLLLLSLVSASNFYAQEKKPIDHSVYDNWKDIKNPIISNDGRYVSFEINPQKGDGNLVLLDTKTNKYDTISRGTKAIFGSGSNFLVYTIKAQFDTVREAELKKVKKDKMPKDSLGILVLNSDKVIKYPKLKSVKVPEKSSDWIAVMLEKAETIEKEADSTKKEKKKKSPKKKKDKELGTLVLFNPISGDSLSFESVSKYSISKIGNTAAFLRVKNDSIDSVSLYVFNAKSKVDKLLFEKAGFAKNIAIDEQGEQLAYTYSSDTAKVKAYGLYYRRITANEQKLVQSNDFLFEGESWSVSPHGKIYFNEAGTELYYGTTLKPEPETKDTLTANEKVSLDIWNWKDPLLQPHQLKDLDKEKKRSYVAVYHPKSGKTIQLGKPELERVTINSKANGHYSIGQSNKAYRKLLSWEASRYKDVFIINRMTGEELKFLDKVASSVSLSPDQKFICWYNIADSSWNSYEIESKVSNNLTKNMEVAFYFELNDMPNEARPYGMAGWTKSGQVVVYDRYDLWLLDPSGKKKPENLTGGVGRESNVKLRYVKLDKELQYLPDQLLLSAFNEENKQAGYFMFGLKKRTLEELVLTNNYYSRPIKAKDADKMIWRKESFTLYPDLYVSTTNLSDIVRISDANPQQIEYNWGSTELVSWNSLDGEKAKGILVKPENFDPQKKYPMIVYFYERSSDRLNRYYTPKPIRSTVNWTYYASNEYILFIPDIKYKTGYPGPSGFDYIVSGTLAMCDQFGFIDRDNLGIQGQSWGGYQTAYIITQTNLYKAAMAGAPVSNMTSAYGGIRWGSGLSRAFQYEESQSRIGATLWERRDLYILNSPLFFADRIETPLLMMHNDNDGAVPWYQGIEFFSALRRLNKPVWMLVYNKAPHNLKRRADMEDLTIRMQQFFDFYLKSAAEPVWMKSGIPALQKGDEFGFETE